MSDNTESLVLELLRTLRNDVATLRTDIRSDLRDVRHRLGNIEGALASVKSDIAHLAAVDAQQGVAFDRIIERIERIEHRLEIS